MMNMALNTELATRRRQAVLACLLGVMTLAAVLVAAPRTVANHAAPTVGLVSNTPTLTTNSFGWVIPDAYKQACITGSYQATRAATCPVLYFGGYTYWAYSDDNNMGDLLIVAYDPTGTIAGQWERLGGGRYVWQITVDLATQTVTFDLQDPNNPAVFTWSELDLGDHVGQPPVTAYSVCPLFDTTRPFKQGSTVPVKLQICNADGSNLSATDLVVHAASFTRVSSSVDGTVQDAGNANPGNDFRYDASLGGYIYNLSTKGLASGTYVLAFTVDGVADPAYAITVELR